MNTQKPIMSKQAELNILAKLHQSDSYFSASVSLADYEQMQRNIASDFPLFCNTSLGWAKRIYDENKKFTEETEKRSVHVELEKVEILPQRFNLRELTPALKCIFHDVYGEATIHGLLYINEAGTDYVLETSTGDLSISQYSDMAYGFARLYSFLAKQAGFIDTVLGRKLFEMALGEKSSVNL